MVKYLDNNSGFSQWKSMHSENKKPHGFGFLGWLILFMIMWWFMGGFKPVAENNVPDTNIATIGESSLVTENIDSEKISMSLQGIRLSQISLKELKETNNGTEPVTLLKSDKNFIEVGMLSSDIQTPGINTKWNKKQDVMNWNNGSKISFERKISVENYLITISDTVKNNSGKDVTITPYAKILNSDIPASSSAVETGGVVYANSELKYNDIKNLDKKSFAYSTVRGFFGFAEQYWESLIGMDTNDQTISMKKIGDLYSIDSVSNPIKIDAGKDVVVNTFVFVGPRSQQVLNSVDNKIPNISKTIDYGWFWFFARPMLWGLNELYVLFGNYGIAIIIITIILRLLIWPLTRKSYMNTMLMQKMQPELQRVQKLYANDKMRLQMETMRIYKNYKTSPMSGCLPMLIQIPIFFALYKALLISVPMRNAGFLWVSDLSVMDPYFILPILMGITMWVQQEFQTAKANKDISGPMASTQKIMKWLPILFVFMFMWMPAGLVLYWTISNVLGMIQMYIIKKVHK